MVVGEGLVFAFYFAVFHSIQDNKRDGWWKMWCIISIDCLYFKEEGVDNFKLLYWVVVYETLIKKIPNGSIPKNWSLMGYQKVKKTKQ